MQQDYFLGKIERKRNKKIVKEQIETFHKKIFYENPYRFKIRISIPKNFIYLWVLCNKQLLCKFLKEVKIDKDKKGYSITKEGEMFLLKYKEIRAFVDSFVA